MTNFNPYRIRNAWNTVASLSLTVRLNLFCRSAMTDVCHSSALLDVHRMNCARSTAVSSDSFNTRARKMQ